MSLEILAVEPTKVTIIDEHITPEDRSAYAAAIETAYHRRSLRLEEGRVNVTPPYTKDHYEAESTQEGGIVYIRREHDLITRLWHLFQGRLLRRKVHEDIVKLNPGESVPIGPMKPLYPVVEPPVLSTPYGWEMTVMKVVIAK